MLKLIPSAGINNVSRDTDLILPERPIYLRDAVNVDVSESGRIDMRGGFRKAVDLPLRHVWQSPLHKDVFAVLNGKWVKADLVHGNHEELAAVGTGYAYHAVLDNRVLLSAPGGLFVYDGKSAQRLTVDTPPAPAAYSGSGSSLPKGRYGLAVSWLRQGLESAVSTAAFVDVSDGGSISVTFPHDFTGSADTVLLYMTKPDGGELLLVGKYGIQTAAIDIPALPKYGRVASFVHLSPMRSGRFLCYWRGRLLVAESNVLRFSEPQAYHLHSERHGFVQMGQRITFIAPVDGGVWVGQKDHVVFLAGASPEEWVLRRKESKPPVEDTAVCVPSEFIGGEISQGGSQTAVWIAANGYVFGTSSGQLIERHADIIKGIHPNGGNSVVLDKRIYTRVW